MFNLASYYNNNIFTYYSPNTSSWKTITLPNGLYDSTFLNQQLAQAFTTNNDFTVSGTSITYPITFISSEYLDRVQMTIQANYQIDFTTSQLYQLLGFNSQIYNPGVLVPMVKIIDELKPKLLLIIIP